MANKATFLAGMAVGYVLGARAGRERYETIRSVARRVRSHPAVQRAATSLGQQAGDLAVTATRVVGDRVGERLPFNVMRSERTYGAPNGRRTR